jgi:hypothetical protein
MKHVTLILAFLIAGCGLAPSDAQPKTYTTISGVVSVVEAGDRYNQLIKFADGRVFKADIKKFTIVVGKWNDIKIDNYLGVVHVDVRDAEKR